jgi:protein-L-isoaspartate(D-aspartate) O-methyltransferase
MTRNNAVGKLRNVQRTKRDWLHVSCALFLDGGRMLPHIPWKSLLDSLEQWRRERRFELFFFLQKPPGLRLRFYGENLGSRLEPELATWLAAAERGNDIRGYRFCVYEAETFRFGGLAGMAIAHHLFDHDSQATLQYETLSQDSRLGLSRDLFSLFQVNDLLAHSLEDRAEIWDVWQNLAHTLGASDAHNSISAQKCVRVSEAITLAPAFKDKLSSEATELLDRVTQDNERVAQQLRDIVSAGRLKVGLRAWLRAAIVFHWNRLGLTRDELCIMTTTMVRLLCPHETKF